MVNGEKRQGANSEDDLRRARPSSHQLLAGLTLEPGDVIATGTPSGVGYAMEPPRRSKRGDVVACSIDAHRHADQSRGRGLS